MSVKAVRVILSSPIMLADGVYKRRTITQEQAQSWLGTSDYECFSMHETVKILGIEPAKDRKECDWYDEALILSPKSRLERREYTKEEIESIGVDFLLCERVYANPDWLE